jgi:hypothetical protein
MALSCVNVALTQKFADRHIYIIDVKEFNNSYKLESY